eukprot:COSAG05_NODE_14144_length_406_cov_1.156352_2_plen_80_part_00
MRVLRPTICVATRLQIKRLEYEIGCVYKQISAYISWPFVAETKAVCPDKRLKRVRDKAWLVAKANIACSRREEWKACRV